MGRDDNHNRIEDYLDGLLDEKDRAVLENSFVGDNQLMEDLKLSEYAREVTQLAGRQHLKSQFNDFEEELVSKQRKARVVGMRWLAIAASFLVLVSAGFWFLNREATSPAELFAANFEVYRPPVNIRGGDENAQVIWEQAKAAYANGDFEKAAKGFEEAIEKNAQVAYLSQFYLGISLLANHSSDSQKAIAAFDEVLNLDNDYREQAMWYKGLALLNLNDVESAKSIFKEIVDNQWFNYKKARAILEMF